MTEQEKYEWAFREGAKAMRGIAISVCNDGSELFKHRTGSVANGCIHVWMRLESRPLPAPGPCPWPAQGQATGQGQADGQEAGDKQQRATWVVSRSVAESVLGAEKASAMECLVMSGQCPSVRWFTNGPEDWIFATSRTLSCSTSDGAAKDEKIKNLQATIARLRSRCAGQAESQRGLEAKARALKAVGRWLAEAPPEAREAMGAKAAAVAAEARRPEALKEVMGTIEKANMCGQAFKYGGVQ